MGRKVRKFDFFLLKDLTKSFSVSCLFFNFQETLSGYVRETYSYFTGKFEMLS